MRLNQNCRWTKQRGQPRRDRTTKIISLFPSCNPVGPCNKEQRNGAHMRCQWSNRPPIEQVIWSCPASCLGRWTPSCSTPMSIDISVKERWFQFSCGHHEACFLDTTSHYGSALWYPTTELYPSTPDNAALVAPTYGPEKSDQNYTPFLLQCNTACWELVALSLASRSGWIAALERHASLSPPHL